MIRVLAAAGLLPSAPKYLEYRDGNHLRRRRITRAHSRVMRALLAEPGLSGYPLSRAAKVGAGKVYVVLDDLEGAGWVAGEWEQRDDGLPRRRFYSLTPPGREAVTKFIEEEDRMAKSGKRGAAGWVILTALAVLVVGAVFTSVIVVIWPEHEPTWALRVSAGGVQGGVLLTAVAATLWILRRDRS